MLQFVFNRQTAEILTLSLRLFGDSRKKSHVGLQRIAIARVLEDQLARDLHLRFGNFVEGINLRIIYDRAIQPAIYGLA